MRRASRRGVDVVYARQVVAIAYTLVFTTGMSQEACRDWKKSTSEHKTRTNFKVDFGLLYKELHESHLTTEGARILLQNNNVNQ